MASSIPEFQLNNDCRIPAIGVGCWMGHPGGANNVQQMVECALKIGYRHIDTAFAYDNEEDVGKAIRNSGVHREEIFLVTKLMDIHHGAVREGFDISLKNLGVEYVDLYLMHWPQARDPNGRVLKPEEHPTFVDTWREMEKLVEDGRVKSIGVSNFSVKNLDVLLPHVKITPAVNQVEMHPFLPQLDLLDYCNKRGIVLTAYTPLGKGRAELLEHPVLSELANRIGCTTAQVILGWFIKKGVVAIPKSANKLRLKVNLTHAGIASEDEVRIDAIHTAPGLHRSMTRYHGEEGTAFGWTYEQLGWPFKQGGTVS